MQRDRRRDPYPWTWEVPLAVALACGFAVVAGLQLGRSVANVLAGAGWTWPKSDAGRFASPIGAAFWTGLPAVVAGDAGAGLQHAEPDPTRLAPPVLLWSCLGAAEVLVIAILAGLAVSALRRWGPGRMRGMATAAEAERLLGITRLRTVAAIVRPDLHGPGTRNPRRRLPGIGRWGHPRRRGRNHGWDTAQEPRPLVEGNRHRWRAPEGAGGSAGDRAGRSPAVVPDLSERRG